jgi:hypothetical protein
MVEKRTAVNNGALLALLSLAPLGASAQTIRELGLDTIENLGREIDRLDTAASVATDILLAQGLDLDGFPLRGWVVTDDAAGSLVTFVGEYDGVYKAVFDIRPGNSERSRFRLAGQRDLTRQEAAKFRARATSASAVTEPCSERYNSVVVADPEHEGWIVYWLAATTVPTQIAVGGHYRVSVSADGASIASADRLSVACMTGDVPADQEGQEPAAFVVTHLASPTPVETHVFLSLQHGVPFIVVTGEEKAWSVVDGEIEPYDLPRQPPP